MTKEKEGNLWDFDPNKAIPNIKSSFMYEQLDPYSYEYNDSDYDEDYGYEESVEHYEGNSDLSEQQSLLWEQRWLA